jgi:hypothetical protein
VVFVDLIDDWLSRSESRVKWLNRFSSSYSPRTGVNQGSVLAPALFAVYINDLSGFCNSSELGLILVYANDILLLSRTRCNMQIWLNLHLNLDKCSIIRVGSRFRCACTPIFSLDDFAIPDINELRYLGVYFVSGGTVRFSMDHAKRSFVKATNAILGKFWTVLMRILLFIC